MTDKELRERAENVWRDGQDAFFSQQEIKGDGCDAATPIITAALRTAY